MFAEELGLAIWWIELDADENFDVAEVCGTIAKWQLHDYAQTFAERGKEAYREGLEFAEKYNLSLSKAFALLAGTASWNGTDYQFFAGKFVVKEREWAETVATIYSAVVAIAPRLRNQRFMEACIAVCRVPGFDIKRFMEGADKYREKLHPFTTRDAFLEMIEEIYNFHRSTKSLMAVKLLAIKAMRARNFAHKNEG